MFVINFLDCLSLAVKIHSPSVPDKEPLQKKLPGELCIYIHISVTLPHNCIIIFKVHVYGFCITVVAQLAEC